MPSLHYSSVFDSYDSERPAQAECFPFVSRRACALLIAVLIPTLVIEDVTDTTYQRIGRFRRCREVDGDDTWARWEVVVF